MTGFSRGSFGPRSAPEGERKNGDLLGGDCCGTAGIELSVPLGVGRVVDWGVRGRAFYEVGNVWNWGQSGFGERK